MNLEQMECIVEIAKTGSLSKAANQMNVTRSAVSQSITNLETELGIKLFIRSHAGAVPTADGEIIIHKASVILKEVQGIKAEAAKRSNSPVHELRISGTPAQLPLITDTYFSFKKEHPQFHLSFTENTALQIIDDIEHNRIDVGLFVLLDSFLHDRPHLLTLPLARTKLVLVVSRTSPLAGITSISMEQFLDVPLVLYQEDLVTRLFTEDVAKRHRPLNISLYTDNLDAMRTMVSGNYVATIVTELAIRSFSLYNDNFVCIDIEHFGWDDLTIGLVRLQEKHLSETVHLFLEQLENDLSKWNY
ncbi:LysR family transcriptional regulator [Paenibacillus albus]|nr:LysR family transcriptional regulator [Paenibacillus albus]